MTFRCLFEQSGTFKNVLKSYGHAAFDYDIQNDYGQTDYVIDLFAEIENEYENITNGGGYTTIFTAMKPDTDFVLAFFPCTFFSELNEINFKLPKCKKIEIPHIERILKREENRTKFFTTFLKFCFVCQEKGVPAIIENPKGIYNRTFLELYSPYRASFQEKDRSKFGDKFIKPTNYYAINFEMKEKFMMFDIEPNTTPVMDNSGNFRKGRKALHKAGSRERSEITPRYADNFYRRFLEGRV